MKTLLPTKFENVSLEDYRPFQDIERTIHLDDYANKNEETFKTSNISQRDNSILNKDIKVLWFNTSRPENEHHFYGNISFCIDINKLLDHFSTNLGYELFWIEVVMWNKHYSSRVMLTKKDLKSLDTWTSFKCNRIFDKEGVRDAMCCPLKEIGYPIYQDNSGKFYELYKLDESKYFHDKNEVEFLLDISEEDCLWLRENCECKPVEHSRANLRRINGLYAPRSCHKYNYVRKQECISPYNIKQTEQLLKSINNRNVTPRQRRSRKNKTSKKSPDVTFSGYSEHVHSRLSFGSDQWGDYDHYNHSSYEECNDLHGDIPYNSRQRIEVIRSPYNQARHNYYDYNHDNLYNSQPQHLPKMINNYNRNLRDIPFSCRDQLTQMTDDWYTRYLDYYDFNHDNLYSQQLQNPMRMNDFDWLDSSYYCNNYDYYRNVNINRGRECYRLPREVL